MIIALFVSFLWCGDQMGDLNRASFLSLSYISSPLFTFFLLFTLEMGTVWPLTGRITLLSFYLYPFFCDLLSSCKAGTCQAGCSSWVSKHDIFSLASLCSWGRSQSSVVWGEKEMVDVGQTVWFSSLAAYPTIRLFVKPSTVRNDEEEHIICELDGFYPEAFSIKWGKYTLKDSQFQEITEGHVTGPTLKNDDGTFNVSSYLTLRPSLEDRGTTYQCVVLHRSLLVPKRLNVTLSEKGKLPPMFFPPRTWD